MRKNQRIRQQSNTPLFPNDLFRPRVFPKPLLAVNFEDAKKHFLAERFSKDSRGANAAAESVQGTLIPNATQGRAVLALKSKGSDRGAGDPCGTGVYDGRCEDCFSMVQDFAMVQSAASGCMCGER